MTVYFDPKKVLEQKLNKEEQVPKNDDVKEGVATLVGVIVGLLVKPLLVMLLWNWIVPGMFGLTTLSYFSAMGLCILVKLFI